MAQLENRPSTTFVVHDWIGMSAAFRVERCWQSE
jgi:hypothetical protein